MTETHETPPPSRFDIWHVAVILAFLLIFIAAWLPLGWRSTPISDGWAEQRKVLTGQPPWEFDQARPFGFLPQYIALSLTPNSFFGWNLMTMLFTFGWSVFTYLILRQFKEIPPAWAFLVAALTPFYPADSAQFWLGGITVHMTVTLFLLAVFGLLKYWHHPHPGWLATVVVGLVLNLWVYENNVVIILAMPILLALLRGQFDRHIKKSMVVWYGIIALKVIHQIMLIVTTSTRMEAAFDLNLGQILLSFRNMFARLFGEQWWKALTYFCDNPTVGLIIVISAASAVLLLFLQARQLVPGTSDQISFRRAVVLVLIGLFVMLASFAPYTFSWAIRLVYYRTLFTTSIGAALLVVTILGMGTSLMRRWGRWVFSIFGATLIGLTLSYAHFITASQYRIIHKQQALLGAIMQIVPEVEEETTFLIVMPDDVRRDLEGIGGRAALLRRALGYFYDDYSINAVIYTPAFPNWEDTWKVSFTSDMIVSTHLTYTGSINEISYSWETAIVMEYSNTGNLILLDEVPADIIHATINDYDPHVRIIDNAAPSIRACKALLLQFRPAGCR